MESGEKVILAVDIGGSKYITGLIKKTGEIIFKERKEWPEISTERIIDVILSAMDQAIKRFPEYKIEAVGMTIPGLADPAAGIWISSNNLGIHNLPIVKIVREKFGLPVYIDNDGRACALAEKWIGSCRDCNDFLYITVSTGVGGAFFLNGDLYYGAAGSAGEIGQCVVVENGRLARNGTRGALEMYAATGGLVENFLEAGGSKTIDGKAPDGKSITRLAAEGDKSAIKAFELEGYYLGKVIAVVYNLLDIEKVIIGGGLSLAFDYYKKTLFETVKNDSFPKANSKLIIEPTTLGYEGALLGAAALAMRGLGKKE